MPIITGGGESQEQHKPRYEQLTGINQGVKDAPQWSDQWLLSEYIQCTDGLIGKMDGSIKLTDAEYYVKTGETTVASRKEDLPPPTDVIYLDKSARPVSWMVREMWDTLATRRPDGSIPPKPNTHYLGIDKEDWLRLMGVEEQYIQDATPDAIDFSKVPREFITRIRALYSTAPITEDNLEDAWNHPTKFDGKHVMIVDEVSSSGKTLLIAQQLLALAIPEAKFSGTHWAVPLKVPLNGGALNNGVMAYQMQWAPVWYSRREELGRGVSDTDPEWPETQAAILWPDEEERAKHPLSRAMTVGRHILTTRPHVRKENDDGTSKIEFTIDNKGNQLREEIHHMAEDLRNLQVLYRPHADRFTRNQTNQLETEEERQRRLAPIKARIERLNGISYDDWIQKRNSLEPKPRK